MNYLKVVLSSVQSDLKILKELVGSQAHIDCVGVHY